MQSLFRIRLLALAMLLTVGSVSCALTSYNNATDVEGAGQDLDKDGFVEAEDCDDNDASIYPGAPEVCNGIDDDCDGAVPYEEEIDVDGDGVFACIDCDDHNPLALAEIILYKDADGDGYGDPDLSVGACEEMSGFVDNGGDCDDSDPDAVPGASWYIDNDGDGYGIEGVPLVQCEHPDGYAPNDEDCDDSNADAYPGQVWKEDLDGDGYGNSSRIIESCEQPFGYVAEGHDCDDTNPDAYPGQIWSIDQDGDGYGEWSRGEEICEPPGNGYAPDATDCDDTDSNINPGALEICNGLDDDCDGLLPEDEQDNDGDGYSPCEGDEDDEDIKNFPDIFDFSGILTNLAIADLLGWEECFVDYFGNNSAISAIQSLCNKAHVLVGCRQSGSSMLTVAANAPFSDVFFNTGDGGNTLHNANGVNWYFSSNYSMGYVNSVDSVSRNSCDTGSGVYPQHRVCFHTGSNNLNGGYRCGATISLNSSTSWQRMFFHSD